MKVKNSTEKLLVFLAFIILTVVGFFVIPPFIDKIASKLYKVSLKNEEIDYDDMGPEIIPKDKEE